MTDRELMDAPEIAQIRKGIAMADAALAKLRKRCGLSLEIYCETGQPYLIDAQRHTYPAPGLIPKGSIVARISTKTRCWDGGGWTSVGYSA